MFQQPTLESQKPSVHTVRAPWTLTHGFYAVMGGFAIHIPEDLREAEKFLPQGSNGRRFITCKGIQLLVEKEDQQHELPDITKQEIQSKSKANGLGKALVCIQALWFVAQCLTRRM